MIKNPITGEILPKNWRLVKVDSIKSSEKYSCVAGPFGSDISSQYFQEVGVPVIRGNNLSLKSEKFLSKGFVFVSEQRALKYKAQIVQADDLVFTCWGSIGQVGIIPKDGPFQKYIISNKQLKLRVNKDFVNPCFLYYYFSSPALVKYINNIAIGSAVPGINLGILKNIPLSLPPIDEQNCIVGLLDKFYNLIENNNQRIKLLGEMAEEIYKEWFVRMRFPGYHSSKFYNEAGEEVSHGTKGALPEGWSYSKLRDCIDHYIGGGWGNEKSSGKNSEPAYVIRGTDISNTTKGNLNFDILRYHSKSNLQTRKLKINDIIFEVSGGTESQSLGRAAFISKLLIDRFDHDIICASFCKLIRPNFIKIAGSYFYQYLTWIYKTGEIMLFQVQSTGISNFKFEDFISFHKIKIPSKDIQSKFRELVEPMHDEIQILGSKNQILQQTRDLLLPRLMS